MDLNDSIVEVGRNGKTRKLYAATCDCCGKSRGYVRKEAAELLCRSCSMRKINIRKQQARLDEKGIIGNAEDYEWRYPPSGKIAAIRLWCSVCGKDRGYCIPQNAGPLCNSCASKLDMISRDWVGAQHPGWRGGLPLCVSCGDILSKKDSASGLCRRCYLHSVTTENSRRRSYVQAFRTRKWYLRWRKEILARDENTCQFTGMGGDSVRLVVHHHTVSFHDMVMEAASVYGEENTEKISQHLAQQHTLDIGITVEATYHLTVLHSKMNASILNKNATPSKTSTAMTTAFP